MKFAELIKKYKFLDFRKYISANLIIIVSFCLCTLILIHRISDFPPPILTSEWGEPYYNYCDTEQMIIDGKIICMFVMAFLFFVALFEFFLRAVVEFIYKKFYSKKIKTKPFAIKFPKPVILAYLIIFYTGFISSFLFVLYLLFTEDTDFFLFAFSHTVIYLS